MQKELTIYFHEDSKLPTDKLEISEPHPSGFTAIRFGGDIAFLEGRINHLFLIVNELRISIYPNDLGDSISNMGEWVEDLKKLYNFFTKVDPQVLRNFMKCSWNLNLTYGRYDERIDFAMLIDEDIKERFNPVNKPYILVEDDFNHIFSNDTFEDSLKEKNIYDIDYYDGRAVVQFLDDIEEDTILGAIKNVIEIARIDKEVYKEQREVTDKYCSENKPWEKIK